MNQIKLKNNSTLSRVSTGKNKNLIFFPGGPGLKSNYLIDLIKNSRPDANCWVFDFDSESNFFKWKEDCIEAINILSNVIVVGHSFGGWFLLSIEEIPSIVEGILLLNTTPSKKAFSKNTLNSPITILDECDLNKKFDENPTDENLKALFKLWIPYYFLPEFAKKGLELFEKNEFSAKIFLQGFRDFNEYKYAWKNFNIKTWAIFGEFDTLCTIDTFQAEPFFINNPFFQCYNVSYSSHFPWCENMKEFRTLLNRFINI